MRKESVKNHGKSIRSKLLNVAHEKFAARPTLDIDFLGNNISNDSERIVRPFRNEKMATPVFLCPNGTRK